jgi:addiction module HigA family antidote
MIKAYKTNKTMRMHNPPHPGEVLKEWFAEVNVTTAASNLGITGAHLSRILNGHAGISAEMALRLAACLNTSPESWLQMQINYDLWQAKQV